MAACSNSRQGVPPAGCGVLPATGPEGQTVRARPLPGGASNVTPSQVPADAEPQPRARQTGRGHLPGSRPGRPSRLVVVGREPLPGVFPVTAGDAVRVAGWGVSRVKAIVWDPKTNGWAASCILAGLVRLGRIEPVRR